MGSTRWDDGEYYGKKSRNNFRRLDKMLNKEFDSCQDKSVDDATLERILKIITKQNNIAHTITKLVEALTLNKKMIELNHIIHAVPPDVISKWVQSTPELQTPEWR